MTADQPGVDLPMGIHPGMPEDEYRRDPGLGSTDVRNLLKAVRKFHDGRDREHHADHFDFGTAVHALVLGGRPVVEVQSESWRATSAQAERKQIRTAGGVPLLAKDMRRAEAVAEAVQDATDLLRGGHAEASAFTERDGIRLKARADVWHPGQGLADLKTTTSAHPDDFTKSIGRFGYDLQAAHYRHVFHGDLPFFIVAVETEPPYMAQEYQLGGDVLAEAHHRVMAAYAIAADMPTDPPRTYRPGVCRVDSVRRWETDLEVI